MVTVSSSLHKIASRFNLDDPLFQKGYSLFGAYAQVRLSHATRRLTLG